MLSNVIGKDEQLKNNKENDGKPEYTDKPITHTYLKELNQATFWDGFNYHHESVK